MVRAAETVWRGAQHFHPNFTQLEAINLGFTHDSPLSIPDMTNPTPTQLDVPARLF